MDETETAALNQCQSKTSAAQPSEFPRGHDAEVARRADDRLNVSEKLANVPAT